MTFNIYFYGNVECCTSTSTHEDSGKLQIYDSQFSIFVGEIFQQLLNVHFCARKLQANNGAATWQSGYKVFISPLHPKAKLGVKAIHLVSCHIIENVFRLKGNEDVLSDLILEIFDGGLFTVTCSFQVIKKIYAGWF